MLTQTNQLREKLKCDTYVDEQQLDEGKCHLGMSEILLFNAK